MSSLGRRLLALSSLRQSVTITLETLGLPAVWSRTLNQQTSLLSSIPDAWGKPSSYTEGTDFLGTPKDHLSLVEKRPKAPDVFNIGFKGLHYAFPLAAMSSVMNRITGAVLWTGVTGVGCLAVVTDVGALVDVAKASFPLILYPCKFGVSYCLIYHYLGGLRHFWFDYGDHGPTQASKKSPLELSTVHQSSVVLIGMATLLSLAFTIA